MRGERRGKRGQGKTISGGIRVEGLSENQDKKTFIRETFVKRIEIISFSAKNSCKLKYPG